MPFEEARTLLVLGATRRRARMKRPAREALEQALAIFDELGARLWAEKARAELARIGGRRAPATGELTPTEQRIAALAAEGRSNKEIATALFVTPKTVGTQLSRIYRKVGVHSRTELARRMSGHPRRPKCRNSPTFSRAAAAVASAAMTRFHSRKEPCHEDPEDLSGGGRCGRHWRNAGSAQPLRPVTS